MNGSKSELVERVLSRRRELDHAIDMYAALEASLARIECRGEQVAAAFIDGHRAAMTEWRDRALDCMVLLRGDLMECRKNKGVRQC